ncbi:MAG TPA: tetratricopeptide repeat protein [Terriglobales bacterium]|nr:tetratricopeptide repeat protein [Terriglobales bacterium]
MKAIRQRAVSVLLLALLISTAAGAARKHAPAHQAPPEDPVAVAIDHLRNLEYDPAENLLLEFQQKHPDDLRAWNLLGTVILYREMFQRGLLESHLYGKKGEVFQPTTTPVSEEFERKLFEVLDKAHALADTRLQKDPNDRDALYWGGVSHGTRATYLFAVKRSYTAALGQAKAANKQHKALLKLDPAYVDANLIVGVQDYVVGSLPWPVKVLAALVGAHGNREQGLREIELVAQKGNYARDDARTVLAVLYQREERWGDARRVLEELAQRFPRGFLSANELAAVCSRLDDWRCVAATYDELLAKYHAGPPNPSWKRFWVAKALYLSGQAHVKLGEDEPALARYGEAAQLSGDEAYIRRAQLADAELLQRLGRSEEARQHYQQLASAFPDSEEGKAARKALRQ